MIGHVIHGHGPVRVLALHGWFGDSTVFSPLLSGLDPDRYSLALMDYRGYGASRAMDGPFDIATIASDAAALADHLGWDGFSIMGHSMGGKAALRLAANAPARVERILALTPVWAGAAPFDAETSAFFRGAGEDVGVRDAIIRNTTGGRYPAWWSRRLAEQSWQVSTPAAFAAYFESWALDDFGAEAATLAHPTLVVVGAEDTGVPEAMARATWLSLLRAAELQVMTGCGHYPMLEQPPALAAIFEAFFASPT